VPLDRTPEAFNKIELTVELGEADEEVTSLLDHLLNERMAEHPIGMQLQLEYTATHRSHFIKLRCLSRGVTLQKRRR